MTRTGSLNDYESQRLVSSHPPRPTSLHHYREASLSCCLLHKSFSILKRYLMFTGHLYVFPCGVLTVVYVWRPEDNLQCHPSGNFTFGGRVSRCSAGSLAGFLKQVRNGLREESGQRLLD